MNWLLLLGILSVMCITFLCTAVVLYIFVPSMREEIEEDFKTPFKW